ncbi:hypothetical protein Tco_0487294 [Tanacetum coccineum]
MQHRRRREECFWWWCSCCGGVVVGLWWCCGGGVVLLLWLLFGSGVVLLNMENYEGLQQDGPKTLTKQSSSSFFDMAQRTPTYPKTFEEPISSRHPTSHHDTPKIATHMPLQGFAPWSSTNQARPSVIPATPHIVTPLSQQGFAPWSSTNQAGPSQNHDLCSQYDEMPRAFNIEKAGIDLNSPVEDLVYMGSHDTDVYISLHNVDPNKVVVREPVFDRFRRVSKLWKFTIDSSIFIRDYGSRQCETCCFNLAYKRSTEGFMCSVDEQMSYTPLLNTNLYLSALTPITTSEGVWCFSYGSHMGAILWNPSIRKSIGIVIPYMTSQPEIRKIVWGFGVRSDTLDPTFLNISMGKYGAGPWHVFVYTLSSNSWNSLENYRLPRVSIRIKRSCGQTTVSGFIFWGGYEIFFNVDGSCYNISMLVSFDMINHQFHVLDIPSVLRDQLPDPFYISHLGNSLVISGNLIIFENRYICAWLLEVDGYNVTSWRMLFVIPSTNVVKLIGFTKDDDPIVEVDRGRMLHPLQVYDRASEEFHNVGISADGGSFFIGPYKESLILLNV